MSALDEKNAGNAAYKKRDFETAKSHYNKAIALDPTDMTFISNLAAVNFEEKNYDEVIELCAKAVEVGRENRYDTPCIIHVAPCIALLISPV